LTQSTIDPAETRPQESSGPQQTPQSLSKAHIYFSRAGILSQLLLIGTLLLLFSGQLAQSLVQATQHVPAVPAAAKPTSALSPTIIPSPQSSGTAIPAFIVPGRENAPPLQLTGGQYIIYEQNDALYLVSSSGNYAQVIPTTGFINNRATPPILTPGGQLLYSGDGIWLTDIFGGVPRQIATLDAGQVITSMALSNDGKMLAWTTEPANGVGMVVIYAGPLSDPSVVLSQSALDCPCFRIFSFMNGTTAQADHTLLLSDDRGSNEAVQYGLWSLDLRQTPATAQPILDENPQQGPLALIPFGTTLLYSTSEGAVPAPADLSVPSDLALPSYANSLSIGALSSSPLALGAGRVILPEQDNLSNSAQYHWVTTPVFSPDAHTLAYVEFSSDEQVPYDRHSALYTISISGSGLHLSVGKPRLLATSSNKLVELGPWLNNHILTIYADGTLYALDISSGSIATLAQPGSYAQIVAVIGFVGQ
jgi:hypothetical protein